MTEAAIAARGLTKRFGKVVALDHVDLDIPSGSAYGLVGPAASGKSTLVRLVAGLARPTAGTLAISGAAPGSVASRRHVGVLLQHAPLYDWMTARESMTFSATLARVAASEIAAAVDELADRLSIATALDRRVATLPNPSRGRVAIAQALIGQPALVVLDEPFQWLDPEGRRDVLAVLREMRGKQTIVLAAHRLEDVRGLCDRVAVLEAGRLVRSAPVTGQDAVGPPVWVIETGTDAGLAFAGLVARLRAEPWVADVTATGGTARVVVSDEARASRELLRAVVGTGVPVKAFRRESRESRESGE